MMDVGVSYNPSAKYLSDETIYVLQINMSIPDRTEKEETIDDYTKKIKLAFPKDVRKRIQAIRARYKRAIRRNTINFYGLRLADEKLKLNVERLVHNANAELQAIDPSLSAWMVALPLSTRGVMETELREKIYYAIQYQIYTRVLGKIDTLTEENEEELTAKKRNAIKRVLEELRQLNILKDRKIDLTIDMIENMLEMKVSEIRMRIDEELNMLEEMIESL
jgi:hypothetical protein